MVPAVDLPAVFGALRGAGLQIGLATNDTEAPARHHLDQAGVLPHYGTVLEKKSGIGSRGQSGRTHGDIRGERRPLHRRSSGVRPEVLQARADRG